MDGAADAEGASGVLPRSTRSHRVDAGKKGVRCGLRQCKSCYVCCLLFLPQEDRERERELSMFQRGLAGLRCMLRTLVLDTVDNFDWLS